MKTLAAHDIRPCPVCNSDVLDCVLTLPTLRVVACRECGHRAAHHAAGELATDYHTQCDDGAFLNALRATRIRQARRILDCARRQLGGAATLLDYGCGRGWFLEAARAYGFERVAGADTSALAIRLLQERGIPGVLLGPGPHETLPDLPFRPDIVSLLDVVEHLSPDVIVPTIRHLVTRFQPQLVTDPPHRSYFTHRSIHKALAAADLEAVDEFRDRDFEPRFLAQRARVLSPLLRSIAVAVGWVAAALAAATRTEDSLVLFARPRGHPCNANLSVVSA